MASRSAGLLLPISALPSGTLGDDAYRFVDFLAEAGQTRWQVLPVGPPDAFGSPYAALSAFAGNEAWLDPARIVSVAVPPEFERRHRFWLGDYCRFREARGDGSAEEHARYQFAFEEQWLALKAYANASGVQLIGDLPFFVAHDSADVASRPELFKLDRAAGVPPDYFSKTGQLWGTPPYAWKSNRWWIARVRRALQLHDRVRIDHFLGFVRAWEVSARAKTAKRGRWVAGPGARFLSALRRATGTNDLIAEDLGLVTPEAVALRRRFGIPGMRVLHFCFGEDGAARPHHFERDLVVYTGTHDNDTTVGWHRKGGADARRAKRYAACTGKDIHWGLIRVAHQSVADTAIIPVQDVLGLGSRARLNRPGTTRGNWSWRLQRGQLKKQHARRLRELTEDAGR